MLTCTRRLTFAAGHRVLGHEGQCANFHGHNYVVEVTAEAELDSVGRVIDFSVLKEKIGGWINTHWDHGFIVCLADENGMRATAVVQAHGTTGKRFVATFNPTAENMANYLLRNVCPDALEGTGVRVSHIRLYETENCWADASL